MAGAMWGAGQPGAGDPGEFRIAITSVARGRNPGELLYSLETDSISGIFAVDAAGVEQRLFHTADFRVRHMALNPDGTRIAASIVHPDFTANIAVLQVEGPEFFEASEGDSLDLAPRWVPGAGRKLVFQSAGVGRDGGGRFSGLGPFAVQQIDLDSGEMECLAEEPEHDLLAPQKDASGALYYIRRPYTAAGRKRARYGRWSTRCCSRSAWCRRFFNTSTFSPCATRASRWLPRKAQRSASPISSR